VSGLGIITPECKASHLSHFHYFGRYSHEKLSKLHFLLQQSELLEQLKPAFLHGDADGPDDSSSVGDDDGNVDGNVVGDVDGNVDGNVVGDVDGNVVGDVDGNVVGDVDGDTVGSFVGGNDATR